MDESLQFNINELEGNQDQPLNLDVGDDNLNNLFKTLSENRKKQVISLGTKEQQKQLLQNISETLNEDQIVNALQKQIIKPIIVKPEIIEKPVSILNVEESDLEKSSESVEQESEGNTKIINTETSENNEGVRKINL